MVKVTLEAPPAWATAAQATVLALSLALLLPELRGKLTWVGLVVLYALAIGSTTYGDWRAGLLHLTLREGARRAQSTPAAIRALEFAAAVLGCLAIVVSSPRF